MTWVCFAGAWLAAGLSTAAAEPRNLTQAKAEIIRYVDSGDYHADIAKVAEDAIRFLEQRAKPKVAAEANATAHLAVVFDLDETMFSNVPHMRAMDFGYVPAEWNRWVERGEAPVIEPVREIYRTARKLGIAVLFLSGRRERDRPGTEKNLRGAELSDYAALVLKPDSLEATNAAYKTSVREKFERDGWVIVANVGDQVSDLEGGHAERTFKIPDPFYFSP